MLISLLIYWKWPNRHSSFFIGAFDSPFVIFLNRENVAFNNRNKLHLLLIRNLVAASMAEDPSCDLFKL